MAHLNAIGAAMVAQDPMADYESGIVALASESRSPARGSTISHGRKSTTRQCWNAPRPLSIRALTQCRAHR
ncbi:MAG: hypothetical protein HPM95_06160 [Alphaproteobacteria bacterium]|nr:hypothetical protein [Alphaproteobacteria bacterium]